MGSIIDVYAVMPKNGAEIAGRPVPSGVAIDDELGAGRYRVRLSGQTYEVAGPEGLKRGDRVRVFWEKQAQEFSVPKADKSDALLQEAVWFPLAFGGEKASLKVDVFVPSTPKKAGCPVAVFFLVETDTVHVGKTQWGIHLRGKRLALQLYLENNSESVLTGDWVTGVVDHLTALGFEMEHPLQRLKKPLRAPQGYGVSIRG